MRHAHTPQPRRLKLSTTQNTYSPFRRIVPAHHTTPRFYSAFRCEDPRTPQNTPKSCTMAQGDSERVQQALKLRKEDPRKAEKLIRDIISQPPSVTSEAAIKEYETALIALGELYKDEK